MKLTIGKPNVPADVPPQIADELPVNKLVPPVNKLNALLAKKSGNLAMPTSSALANALANQPLPPPPHKPSTVPALAPLKEKYVLVADATDKLPGEILLQFANKMQMLLDYMDTAQLPEALRNLKMYCDEHKELRSILRAEDVQLFVRAARKSYGMTVVAKETNKGKRATKEGKQSAITADVMDILGAIDLGGTF